VNIDLAALPSDADTLHQLVRDLAAQVADDRSELAQAHAEIERLKLIIRRFQRAQFGRRAERIDGDQLALGLEDVDADIARLQARHPVASVHDISSQATSRREGLPDHLPREDVSIDIDERVCPCCGGALHVIGETVSEMLDFVPARLRVLRIRRPKYGCRACGTIHQAPAPERPIAKGMASPGLLAHVLVSKYCDHTPLYRQSQIFARHGVEIERSTLANWVGGACWWLEPLQARLAAHVFKSAKIFADVTPQFRCWIPAAAAPRPADCGCIRATIGLGAGPIRRRPSTFTVPIARRSDPPRTSNDFMASCRLMVMPGSNG
jgi:transposase